MILAGHSGQLDASTLIADTAALVVVIGAVLGALLRYVFRPIMRTLGQVKITGEAVKTMLHEQAGFTEWRVAVETRANEEAVWRRSVTDWREAADEWRHGLTATLAELDGRLDKHDARLRHIELGRTPSP